jgi:prevent-host-death family protein
MIKIGAFAAKNTLGNLLDLVEKGEEIVITRHGRAVARLVPNFGSVDRTQAAAARERISARAAANQNEGFDWANLKRERDEGRP